MAKFIAAVVGLAIAGQSAMGWTAQDLPLSVSEPSAPLMNWTDRLVPVSAPDSDDAGSSHPELAGAGIVGLYLLFRARKRRVI